MKPNQKMYTHPVEIWSHAQCIKLAKRYTTDAFGNRDHLPGRLHQNFGPIQYNGGCIREGEWYAGEVFPLPELADGFEIIYVPTWWYRIISREDPSL